MRKKIKSIGHAREMMVHMSSFSRTIITSVGVIMFSMCTAVAGSFSVFIAELSDRKTNALDTDRK